MFVAPYFIVFAVFNLYPILYTLLLSFMKWDGLGTPTMIGIANYTRLLSSKYFYQTVGNTFSIYVLSIIPQFSLALFIALLLNTKWIKGRATFRSIFYFPNLVTPVTVGVTFTLLFGNSGVVNILLKTLGLITGPVDWFQGVFSAKMTVAIMLCWQYFGSNVIFFGAGLAAIPQDYYEAAAIDGAGSFQIATRITLPIMKPILMYVFITSIIGGLQVFDVAYMLKDAGNRDYFKTMIYYLYENAFKNSQYGYSAANAYVVFVIIAVFSLISFKLSYGKKEA